MQQYSRLVVFKPEGRGPVEAAAIPTEAERQALEIRQDRLHASLTPAAGNPESMGRIAVAIAEMLGGGYTSLQNVDRKSLVVGYTEALQDLPAWATERACAAVRAGKVEGVNPDWPPTQARMHQIAEGELVPVKAEQPQISHVLALQLPPKRDEGEQARMDAKAKAWLERKDPAAATMAGQWSSKASPEADKARAARMVAGNNDEIRREWEALGLDPMTDGKGSLVSVSLAKSLGRFPPQSNADEAAA